MVIVFLPKIIFEAILDVDHGYEYSWVRCHLKEHILVHIPYTHQRAIQKFQYYLVKNDEGTMNTAIISRLRWLSAFLLHRLTADKWQHVKSFGEIHFSLARRAQHSKALWKYPSHPLFDSANRGGVAVNIHHSRAQCVKQPHAYMYFARNKSSVRHVVYTHVVYSPYCTCMYACSSRAFDQCMLAQSQSWHVTQPSLAPCSEYMHAYCVYTICVLTDTQMVYTIRNMHVTARSQDWLCMHTCTIRAVYNVRVNKFAMDCVKTRVNAICAACTAVYNDVTMKQR